MTNAIFTTKIAPSYDDLPEVRYHFPRTYLNQAQQTVGDWVVYYEPRRQDTSPSGTLGRSSYFAIARVERIELDPRDSGRFYAFVSDYLEFAQPVPFRYDSLYLESALQKHDGSTNKGAFGRAVRILPRSEFEEIVRIGLYEPLSIADEQDAQSLVAEELAPYGAQRQRQSIERPVRDAAFSKSIQVLYQSTCALTGLRIINGGGRCEVEAAHIRPVSDGGPDSPRNGIALSRTMHWLFDRGIVSLTDEGRILASRTHLPEGVRRLLNPSGEIRRPTDLARAPHPAFLDFHRQVVCRGKNLELLE